MVRDLTLLPPDFAHLSDHSHDSDLDRTCSKGITGTGRDAVLGLLNSRLLAFRMLLGRTQVQSDLDLDVQCDLGSPYIDSIVKVYRIQRSFGKGRNVPGAKFLTGYRGLIVQAVSKPAS